MANGIGGFARAEQSVQEWCRTYRWPKQFANYYGLYGIAGATHLAKEYVRRSSHFFGIWVLSDNDPFTYSQEELNSYEETFEWVDWMCSLPVDSASFGRASQLRAFLPQNP